MLERSDAITNEVLEPVTFILAYPTLYLKNVAVTKYYEDVHIKGDEMCGACSICRGEEKYIQS
jgi:hypothetical protein